MMGIFLHGVRGTSAKEYFTTFDLSHLLHVIKPMVIELLSIYAQE